MRLLLLATYFPRPGAPTIGTWALQKATALRRAGAEVVVISLTPWVPSLPEMGRTWRAYAECPETYTWPEEVTTFYPRWFAYPVTRFERIFQRCPQLWLKLAWSAAGSKVESLVKHLRPDVILAHHISVNGWVAHRLHQRFRIPYFLQDHAQWDADIAANSKNFGRLYREVSQNAAGILAVSQKLAGSLRPVCGQTPIQIIPNGVSLPAQPPVDAIRAPVIFSAGMLTGCKGFDLLLQAWAAIAPRFPQARLRIAGDGPEAVKLRELCATLGLQHSVDFLGLLLPNQVRTEMASARLFALPSYNESFGVVYAEAASVGTPVVWPDNAGIADHLADGVHGLMTKTGDIDSIAGALDQLLSDAALAQRLGSAARQQVEAALTWERVAARMLDYLGKVSPSA